jgi:beta-galactosidase
MRSVQENIRVVFIICLAFVSMAFGGISSFDQNWKYIDGDPASAQTTTFNDAAWTAINVPHDFCITHPLTGGVQAWGYFTGGTAWYRKHFTLTAADIAGKVFLEFDGIQQISTIYVNGVSVGTSGYGYIALNFDITSQVVAGDNVVAVRVQSGTTRWYSGAGINRHTWLKIMNKVHLDWFGVYVTTPDNSGAVTVKTTVLNENSTVQTCSIASSILDVDGNAVANAQTSIDVPASGNVSGSQNITIPNPVVWDLATPYCYRVKTAISVGGTVVDSAVTPFGIRQIAWNVTNAFTLNGKKVPLKGMCSHEAWGALGSAFNDEYYERTFHIIKDVGYNSLRSSHNPRDRGAVSLCDRMGLLLFDELYDKWDASHSDFTNSWSSHLKTFLARDRNCPSVILWSVGNETSEQGSGDLTTFTSKYQPMAAYVHANDYRKVTVAFINSGVQTSFAQLMDIGAFNYATGLYDGYHSSLPNLAMLGSEEYSGNPVIAVSWPIVRSRSNYVAGNYTWVGLDYIGEPKVTSTSAHVRNAATIDMVGNIRPYMWVWTSKFVESPMVKIIVQDSRVDRPATTANSQMDYPMMVAHWTHPYMASSPATTVVTPTNCDSVQLFINGASQGVKKRLSGANDTAFNWSINYAAGTIKAIGYKLGVAWYTDSLTTVTGTQKISLTPDRPIMKADGLDRVYVKVTVTDANGSYVPTASQDITFNVTGPATIIAKHNSDAWADFRVGTAYYGTCLVSLQSTGAAGNITLTASATGLTGGSLTIPTNATTAEVPYVFGLSKADALAKISGRGLKTGTIKYQYSASVTDGNVIDQNPVYWSTVAAGASVNLVVSSSTPKVDEVVNVVVSRCVASAPSDIRIIASAHSIDFSVPNLDKTADLRLDLFTLQGKYVQTLFNMKTFGGKFSVPFSQKNAHLGAAAVYCAVLHFGDLRRVLPIRFMKQ